MASIPCHKEGINDIVFHPNGRELLTCGCDGGILRFEAPKKQEEGEEGTIQLLTGSSELEGPKPIKIEISDFEERTPLSCLAVSPKGGQIAVGTLAHCVHLINHDDFKYEALPTRLQSPIRHIVFSSVGPYLICAGDDPTVKVVSLITNKVIPLEGHPGPVRCIACDPKGELIATASEDKLKIWNLKEGKLLETLHQQFYKTVVSDEIQLRMSWHPKGRYLAIPGSINVILLNPELWNVTTALKHHSQEVTICCWSANGEYLATTGLDKKLVVWELQSKRVVDTLRLDELVMAVSWNPVDNKTIAYSLKDGSVSFWDTWTAKEKSDHSSVLVSVTTESNIIDDKKMQKSDEISISITSSIAVTSVIDSDESDEEDVFRRKNKRKTPKKIKDDEQSEVSGGGGEASPQVKKTPRKLKKWSEKKSKRKKSFIDDAAVDDDNDNNMEIDDISSSRPSVPSAPIFDSQIGSDDSDGGDIDMHMNINMGRASEFPPFEEPRAHRSILDMPIEEIKMMEKERAAETNHPQEVHQEESERTPCQLSFQSGSTRMMKGRKLLVWNLIGAITKRQDEEEGTLDCTIDVEFSDISKHRQVHFPDSHDIKLGALGPMGAFFASKIDEIITDDISDATRIPSHLKYCPFSSWAPNSDWIYDLPDNEDAIAVAVGEKFAAVGTTKHFIRVFSFSGIQRSLFCTSGPIVTLQGQGAYLAVVYHAGAPWEGNQNLGVRLVNIDANKTVYQGALPLSTDSLLQWLTFSEEDVLMALDDLGVLRALIRNCGYEWIPVLDLSTAVENPEDLAWPVGLVGRNLMCALIKSETKQPPVSPRPILTPIKLCLPLLDLEGDGKDEEEHLRATCMLREAQAAMRNKPFRQQEKFEQISKKQIAHLDKTAITYYSRIHKTNPVKALDLLTFVERKVAFRGAIQLANNNRQAVLANKAGALMERKFSKSGRSNRTPMSARRRAPNRTPSSARRPSQQSPQSSPSKQRRAATSTSPSTAMTLSPQRKSRQSISAATFLSPSKQTLLGKRKSATKENQRDNDATQGSARKAKRSTFNPFAIRKDESNGKMRGKKLKFGDEE